MIRQKEYQKNLFGNVTKVVTLLPSWVF